MVTTVNTWLHQTLRLLHPSLLASLERSGVSGGPSTGSKALRRSVRLAPPSHLCKAPAVPHRLRRPASRANQRRPPCADHIDRRIGARSLVPCPNSLLVSASATTGRSHAALRSTLEMATLRNVISVLMSTREDRPNVIAIAAAVILRSRPRLSSHCPTHLLTALHRPTLCALALINCPCTASWNGRIGQYCCKTCRDGAPCARAVHTVPFV